MLIIILSTVFLCLSAWCLEHVNNSEWETFFMAICIVSIAILFVGIIGLPIKHFDINSEIAQYKAVQMTLTASREDLKPIERISVTLKIIELNEKFAKYRYFNRTIFGLWIPDEVDSLYLLK